MFKTLSKTLSISDHIKDLKKQFCDRVKSTVSSDPSRSSCWTPPRRFITLEIDGEFVSFLQRVPHFVANVETNDGNSRRCQEDLMSISCWRKENQFLHEYIVFILPDFIAYQI